MTSIGIMGGTFDPIHRGHLLIAQAALQQLSLHRVMFLPDGDPPHKEPVSDPQDRLRMVQLACEGELRYVVSDMELKRSGRTYTVDTLRHLKEDSPRDDLVYLVGSDTFFLFPTWRTAEEVANLCRMAILLRPGDSPEQVRAAQADFLLRYGLKSHLLEGVGLDLSSSQIRRAVQAGEDIGDMVPEAVAGYIRKHGLYLP